MQVDIDRISSILQAEHSYYGSRTATKRKDTRLVPIEKNILSLWFTPGMDVLDLGCGDGDTLLEYSDRIHFGLGVDIDEEFLQEGLENKRARGVQNVDFRILDFPREADQLAPESFDVVYTERGPIDYRYPSSFDAAVRLLRPDGIIFIEDIGESHLHEVDAIFEPPITPTGRVVDRYRQALESRGVSIRLAADVYTKWYYPDIYEWLFWMCSIWSWLQMPFPQPEDPRIQLFAERNTTSSGEIETTHHLALVGGIKKPGR